LDSAILLHFERYFDLYLYCYPPCCVQSLWFCPLECSPAAVVVGSSGGTVGEHRQQCSLRLQSVYERRTGPQPSWAPDPSHHPGEWPQTHYWTAHWHELQPTCSSGQLHPGLYTLPTQTKSINSHVN